MLTYRIRPYGLALPVAAACLFLAADAGAQSVAATLDDDSLVVASADATVQHSAPVEDEATSETSVSFSASAGAMTSNPWRGDQLALSNAEPWWVTDNAVSIAAGPGSVELGVWAAGDASEGDADFEIPIGYAWQMGSVSTAVDYTVFPTTYTPASDTIHEFGVSFSTEFGAVSPSIGVEVDPFVGAGAYASAGVEVGTDVGRLSLGAGASAGVSGYDGASFGGQDVSTSASLGVELGAGFNSALGLGLSYGFRSEDVIPHAALTLGYAM